MTSLIILLCRNTLDYSRRCLQTLLAQGPDVLIVDNASTDGTAAWAAAQHALPNGIRLCSYPEVYSVATCWNEALNWAWRQGYGKALVVNSDVELLPETYRLLNGHPHGLITGVSVDREPVLPETMQETPHPDYSCFLITRWAHQQVPFDEAYEGAYFEDCDHHVRLFRAGITASGTNVEFRHHRSATLRLASWEEQQRINRHYDRNKLRFYQQYGCFPWTSGYTQLFTPLRAQG